MLISIVLMKFSDILLNCQICKLTLQYSPWKSQKERISNLIPEGRVVKPLQQLLAHFHWARQECPVGQQEVLYEGWIHHRVLLHQMHHQPLGGALRQERGLGTSWNGH